MTATSAPTSTLLEDLIVAATRLSRVAAQSTGTTTPAAVWRTLSILTTDGSLRIGDLARASRVSQPTMTKLVQSLALDGLVSRVSDAADSRASLIAVTPRGTGALVAWRSRLGEALAPMFADLTAEETRILERAVAILEPRTNTNSTSTNSTNTNSTNTNTRSPANAGTHEITGSDSAGSEGEVA